MQTPMQQFIKTLRAAKRVSTPLIVVRTADPASAVKVFQNGVMERPEEYPLVLWDLVHGFSHANELGEETAAKAGSSDDGAALEPAQALIKAQGLGPETVLFVANAHRFMDDADVAQAIYNLRDAFKRDNRTLVLLAIPGARVPAEIADHTLVLDEPLPSPEDLKTIVESVIEDARTQNAELPNIGDHQIARAVDALAGLPAFAAEQAAALSLTLQGMDLERLWQRKVQAITQTSGLSVWRGGERFADIGGVENAKNFLRLVLSRDDPARAVVFIDEIEKAVAGHGTDTSGVKTEMIGTLLSWMQDREVDGLIFIGPAGTAKSGMTKAAGNETGIPTIAFDLSGMQASLVGDSGRNLRTALSVVDAVSQGKPLFIVTCNSLTTLPPELRRRFTLGTFFFDLPGAEDRETIWKIYRAKYQVTGACPDDQQWTGAEIKVCCRNAAQMKIPLVEAAKFIVPVAVSAGDQIRALRTQASGKFIDASKSGLYRFEEREPAPAAQTRAIRIE